MAARSSPKEYVILTTPEEDALNNYFLMLSRFAYDTARDQAGRQRESRFATGGSNWTSLMASLSHLAVAEKFYYSLEFYKLCMQKKKEARKASHEGVLKELERVREIYQQNLGGTDRTWERKMADLCGQLMEYVNIKKDMSLFYLRLAQHDGILDWREAEKQLKDFSDRCKDGFPHSMLKVIKDVMNRELSILSDLVRAQIAISEWDFLPALISIFSTSEKLHSWKGIHVLDNQPEHSKGKIRSKMSLLDTIPLPELYQWMCKMMVVLLSKFSFYFESVLSKQATSTDMKAICSRLQIDFVSLVYSALRQTSLACVCLILDTNGLAFKGSGYHMPESPTLQLQGLGSYPTMITIPKEFDLQSHRPNIVSFVLEILCQKVSTNANMMYQYDENVHSSYLLYQVDVRVVLVGICSTRKSERDHMALALLSEIAIQLRLTNVLAMLKHKN